ncbi:membrane protein insertase YidC [Sphingomonas bacterium]|uniref:membrane protein insertase YidC n=1 Tax=Sphingomonas bacterium TaxID=1895847 RepID=UPI00157667B0|nr:membrane protein insertase YidC [Sphingomonas bacterium]
MKEDSRNFILFAVLAALILFGWPFVSGRLFPAANPPATRIVNGKSQALPNPAADPTADGPVATRDRRVVLAESPRVRIITPRLAGSINLKGPRIDDLVLVQYKETVARHSAPIRLLSPAGAAEAYFAQFGWRGDGLKTPDADAVWKASAPVLSPGHPVALTADNGAGLAFRIDLAVDDGYMISIRQSVGNTGASAVPVAAYGLVSRSGVSKDATSRTIHTGPMSAHEGKADYGIDFADVDKAPQRFTTAGGWLGFTDKYWLTALVPDQARGFDGEFRAGAGAGQARAYQADFTAAPQQLRPGQVVTQTSRFFAGAKETRLIDGYNDGTYGGGGIANFDRAIDWGWFRVVEKPIFYYLDWLFRHVGNYGAAIVLLTCTIRLLMFPIAQRQFASMAAMRAIQPKMKALQERHKDDKTRAQQEVMALYKAEKVNPLAGCLPTFLQIPIFYALYKMLLVTIEMRHQPFVAWIKDLSAPDPLTPVNLFGLLPFTPPGVLHLGILAILLGGTIWLQMRMNPAAADPTQQQVMMFMPWIMMLFFAPLAAGLQLYYIASNLLTLAQQRFLYSRHPQLKVAAVK